MFQFRLRTLFIFTTICAVIALVAVNFRVSVDRYNKSFMLGAYQYIGPPGGSGLPKIQSSDGSIYSDRVRGFGVQYGARSGIKVREYTIRWGEHKWKFKTEKLVQEQEDWPDPKFWRLRVKGDYPWEYPADNDFGLPRTKIGI